MFFRVFIVRIIAVCICYQLQIFAVAADMVATKTNIHERNAVVKCSKYSIDVLQRRRKIECLTDFSHNTFQMKGTGILSPGIWDVEKTSQLQSAFQTLNGFQCLNITDTRENNSVVDFEGSVSVKFNTSELQSIVTTLKTNLAADIWVNTSGMVTIVSPNTTVYFESSPSLKCTFEEPTDRAGWNLIQTKKSFTLNSGSVVKLSASCATLESSSCAEVTLNKVTGAWVGMYECVFTNGSVSHTARAQLNVSLLPDVITMQPGTADCSQNQNDTVHIEISATIQENSEAYQVWWSYSGTGNQLYNTSSNSSSVYTFIAPIRCQKSPDALYVNVTFENTKGQQRSAQVYIPVIYAGSIFCSENMTGGDLWPKTPSGATVIIKACAMGRVGYKSRTCIGPTWQEVYDYCITQQLVSLLKDSNNFLQGLDATPNQAMDIFEELFNSSVSASSNNIADLNASITVLNVMAMASNYTILPEGILPNFINASSNLLEMTWNVASPILYTMSSTFLQAVEDLVKNTEVNTSQGVQSANIELKFCSIRKCDVSVFDIGVKMSTANGILKTAAVRNLMNKLQNNYNNTEPAKLILSATVQHNTNSSSEIQLDFPNDFQTCSKPLCVFWDTTQKKWSDAGCTVYYSDKRRTQCVCNHLTPFSLLMSKGEISENSKPLDVITTVGLAVSICSLLIFLTVECLVWSAVVKTNLAHFRHTAMVNIATFLLLADISMLASSCPSILPDSWCLILTICKHLFYLAMFGWMLCLSIMLVHQLIFIFSPLRKTVVRAFSSVVGYVFPILIVGSSYVYSTYTNNPYYDQETCWLVFHSLFVGSIQSFLFPVGTIIFINFLCIMVVVVTMVKLPVTDTTKADDKNTAKSIVKILSVLTPVSGITWIIGFFQLMLNEKDSMHDVVEFCFTILNSFQGIGILLTGCFKEKKVWQELSKILMETFKRKHVDDTEMPLGENSSTTK